MAQETEAKFYIQRMPELQRAVEKLGASRTNERVHEVNLRFDTPTRDFQRIGRVLRLRQDRRARITYKDSDSMQPGTLSRREVEITVDNFDVARELLEALGYIVAFTYEKYRTTYKLDELEVVLDEMPYGHFVEIEGDEADIRRAAEKLGLKWDTVIRDSYSRLFEKLRAYLNLKFQDLTFDNFQGLRISAADLGVEPADA